MRAKLADKLNPGAEYELSRENPWPWPSCYAELNHQIKWNPDERGIRSAQRRRSHPSSAESASVWPEVVFWDTSVVWKFWQWCFH